MYDVEPYWCLSTALMVNFEPHCICNFKSPWIKLTLTFVVVVINLNCTTLTWEISEHRYNGWCKIARKSPISPILTQPLEESVRFLVSCQQPSTSNCSIAQTVLLHYCTHVLVCLFTRKPFYYCTFYNIIVQFWYYSFVSHCCYQEKWISCRCNAK